MPNLSAFPIPNLPNVGRLLTRYWFEYRQVWKTLFIRDFLDRLLYLCAFGFGFGGLMASSHGGNYLAFLVPGIACSTGAFVMTVAMTFGAYERFTSYKVWQAWLATPIQLPDILLAELIYAALRCMPSIIILLLLAAALHALPSVTGAILALPLIFLANLALGAVALCFTTHIKRSMNFAYVNTLWTTPMFLFSGVFYDPKQAPLALQIFSDLLPLTHVLRVVRPLILAQPVPLLQAGADILILLALLVAAYAYACRGFRRRVFS